MAAGQGCSVAPVSKARHICDVDLESSNNLIEWKIRRSGLNGRDVVAVKSQPITELTLRNMSVGA
ncbi:hypothetical protein A9975_17325 [Cupriavidus sp. UME77]|nr:hypothetical protein [Cupriavidus sp. UME77]